MYYYISLSIIDSKIESKSENSSTISPIEQLTETDDTDTIEYGK